MYVRQLVSAAALTATIFEASTVTVPARRMSSAMASTTFALSTIPSRAFTYACRSETSPGAPVAVATRIVAWPATAGEGLTVIFSMPSALSIEHCLIQATYLSAVALSASEGQRPRQRAASEALVSSSTPAAVMGEPGV